MWHGLGDHLWVWMGVAMLASVVVLALAALWLVEIVAGWPWRDRDHPVRDEIHRLEHPQRRTRDEDG